MDETKTFCTCGYVVIKDAASNRVGLELESSFGLRKRMVITSTRGQKAIGIHARIRTFQSGSSAFLPLTAFP